jgi:hypothetical protein
MALAPYSGAVRPYNSDYIAGYLVPLIFIVCFIGISRLGHVLIRISWSVSAFLLVAYNRNFLQGYRLNTCPLSVRTDLIHHLFVLYG